jgi:hypothetical protein
MMMWGIGYAELVYIEIDIFFVVLLIISNTCTASIKKKNSIKGLKVIEN